MMNREAAVGTPPPGISISRDISTSPESLTILYLSTSPTSLPLIKGVMSCLGKEEGPGKSNYATENTNTIILQL